MRGDSVRDFYAKTLALVGLGLLAGTGALVDYWPASHVELPPADSALVMPELAWTAPPAAPVLPVFPRRASSPIPTPAAAVADLPVLEAEADVPMLYHRVALAAPPADVLMPVAWTAAQHTEIPLSEYEPYEPVAVLASTGVPVATLALSAPSADDDDWWITTAAKRTGSSIARTGARTGASFVGLFRAVNRVVRRALPN